MFSKACEYAIKMMIHLETLRQDGQRAGLKDIARAINSPEAFTAKILQQLTKRGLLQSLRGPTGGFRVRKQQPIFLSEIVQAIDGDDIMKNCVLGFEQCSESHPCPMHDKYKAVRDHLTGILLSTSVEEVNTGLLEGKSYLVE